jgi:hypothetical protein
MDGNGEHHLKWSQPDWEGQNLHVVSYVEHRPNKNSAKKWNTGHTMGSSSMGRVWKLRTWVVLIYYLYKKEYTNFKPTEITIRKGLR